MNTYGSRIKFILQIILWYLDYLLYILFSSHKAKIVGKIKNILIIELLYIGDLIVITPTIRALKNNFLDSNIILMILTEMKEVLEGNPNIDKIISYNLKEIKEDPIKIINDLKNKYDLAIILHPHPELGSLISRIIYKAKIPYRIGCTKVGIRESKGLFLTQKTKPTLKLKHKIDDNLDVIKTIGIITNNKHLELYTTKESDKKINSLFKRNNISKKDFIIAIHPKPKHKTHEWFPERFAELSDKLIKIYNAKIIFTGSIEDKAYIDNIIKKIQYKKYKVFNLPKNSIKEFFSIIKNSNLVISVDTAAMHIAAAFNKPVIALFGAGNPKIWHPYCDNHIDIYKNEVCTSCMKHECFRKGNRYMECMKAITVKDVLDAVNNIQKVI